jgi:hypothetical protein
VQVPPTKCIMVNGTGQMGAESLQQAMGVIYNFAYTPKFRTKDLLKKDCTIMAPEGLWWTKTGKIDQKKPSDWLLTPMAVASTSRPNGCSSTWSKK